MRLRIAARLDRTVRRISNQEEAAREPALDGGRRFPSEEAAENGKRRIGTDALEDFVYLGPVIVRGKNDRHLIALVSEPPDTIADVIDDDEVGV